MSDPDAFNVIQLKEFLKIRGLSTAGTKTSLIARLMEADPSGEWMNEENVNDFCRVGNGLAEDVSIDNRRENRMHQREIEIYKREKEIAERELELARRELALLRGHRDADPVDRSRLEEEIVRGDAPASSRPRLNPMAVADLLADFDGGSDFGTWHRQLEFLRTAYRLDDDYMKILIGMRLKKKALEWFHSKPEFLGMTFDALVLELKTMFGRCQNKIALRRKFEARVWKKDEAFREYVHEKMIMGNRVPIEPDEMLDHIIEGIPDNGLRNQARIQRFTDVESLLAAFEVVTLQDRAAASSRWDRRSDKPVATSGKDDNRHSEKREAAKVRRCFNCGGRDHVNVNCPSKSLGVKCFECGQFGHKASECPRKSNAVKNACAVEYLPRKKYTKDVAINGVKIEALIDTGSDISLMRADEYIKIGSPNFRATETRFSGIGSGEIAALGEFRAQIAIDEYSYPILIRVVSDTVSRKKLLIGTDFLDTVEVNVKRGAITINPIREPTSEESQVSVFQIDVCEANTIDLSHVRDKHGQAVVTLVENYKPNRIAETDVKMTIILKDDEPAYQRARRLSPAEKIIVNAQVDEWLEQGIIRPSNSDFASPVVLVKKKDGSHRLCVDYRLLNKKIIKDRYPLPLIEDQLDQLQNAKFFSTLDLKNGFFHVRMNEASIKYTSFIVPDGQYEFLRVPFGLCNSPSVFQRFINAVFRDLIRERIVLTYMDDLIVLSEDEDNGLKNLEIVLATASRAGLVIKWEKCCFLQKRVEFLGHVIENGTIRPSERKTKAVMHFPEPQNVKQIQAFLGLSGYFRKFVPKYSTIARPLTNLLKADVEFQFGVMERNALNQLKVILSERPVLNLYRVGADTELHIDASKYGYGAILLQKNREDQQLHPIYYASGKTTPAEEKYSSYELEVLAIIRALRRFRVYLLGIPFKIVTDCRAFALTMEKRDLCVRVARWALLLEEFNYALEHRPGKSMVHVDALSRNPLPSCLVIDECEQGLTMRLKRAQREDNELLKLVDASKRGEANGYLVRGGILYKELNDDIRVVVPKGMHMQVIRRAHEQGHFGINKTEALVKRDYWIPNLRPKIEKIIRNCVTCILAERKHGKRECMLSPIEKGSVPLDTFHIDHLGPLPSTKKSYVYIFAVIDAFSKFVWLYATKSTSASEVIDRLRKQSSIFGNPRRIVSDRGSAFTSKEFKEYCESENIEHQLTTTGIPRANGQIERLNRTLISLLTKLSAPNSCEWYKYINAAQLCINTTFHRSIGMTPFRVMLGVHPRIRDDPSIREILDNECVALFSDDRDELRQRARESIIKIQHENKVGYNRNRKEAVRYREGDMVAIRRTQQGPGLKFSHKYLGPYEVIKVLRNHRYMVRKTGEHEGPLQTSTASDYMKPWLEDDDDENSEQDEN